MQMPIPIGLRLGDGHFCVRSQSGRMLPLWPAHAYLNTRRDLVQRRQLRASFIGTTLDWQHQFMHADKRFP